MEHSLLRPFLMGSVVALIMASPCGFGAGLSQAATVNLAVTDHTLELTFPGENGMTSKETIPIFQAGPAKYFSAGVGVEEREAHYPPFPLKLVFVAGSRAYLSQVAVAITNFAGHLQLQIPREQVTGPWLFVDLPPGTYEISAVGPGGALLKEHVVISANQVKTVYLKWKEEKA